MGLESPCGQPTLTFSATQFNPNATASAAVRFIGRLTVTSSPIVANQSAPITAVLTVAADANSTGDEQLTILRGTPQAWRDDEAA